MISNWLLSRVVELMITYLVHSTLFLGVVAIVLTVVACIRRRWSPGNIRQINPIIEERLWKLAATLPLISIPISISAGSSYELSDWSFTERFQPTSAAVLDEGSGDSVSPTSIMQSTKSNFEHPEQDVLDSPPFSLFPGYESSTPLTNSAQVPSDIDKDSFDANLKTSSARLNGQQNTTAPTAEGLFRVVDSPASTSSINWHRWLGVVLLCWLASASIRLLVRAFLVSRVLNRCQPASADLQRIVNRLAMDSSRIRLLTAPASTVLEPFACGICHGTIVLPQGIEDQLTPVEVKALLAHEVAHLVRRDPLWLFVGELLCTGFAFQPLNFIARRRWSQAAELLCDDWAVQQSIPAMSLAACLTRIAELRLDRRGKTWGLAAVGRSGLLVHRVQWLLRDSRATASKSRQRRVRTTAASITLAILVGAFGPRFVLPASAEAESAIDFSLEQIAIQQELSAAVDELERAELLLMKDPDPQTAMFTSRLRVRIQSIRRRLGT